MTDDLISRAEAIEAFDGTKVGEKNCTEYDSGYNDGIDFAVSTLSVLPSAQSEPEEFEWCHDCKEYDQEKHCCHRWTKVIRKTVDEIKADPVRHGKWIRNDNGTYSCSVCQSWIPEQQHYYARYCLHCGARMDEVE